MTETMADTLQERLKKLQEQHAQAVGQYNGLMRAAKEVESRIIEIKGAQREIGEILKQLGQGDATLPKLTVVDKE